MHLKATKLNIKWHPKIRVLRCLWSTEIIIWRCRSHFFLNKGNYWKAMLRWWFCHWEVHWIKSIDNLLLTHWVTKSNRLTCLITSEGNNYNISVQKVGKNYALTGSMFSLFTKFSIRMLTPPRKEKRSGVHNVSKEGTHDVVRIFPLMFTFYCNDRCTSVMYRCVISKFWATRI